MPQTAERMSRVDTAWLRMDNDVNLMMIVGVWLLQPGITLRGAVRAHRATSCSSTTASARRWCRTRWARSWVDDDDFDIDHHVRARDAARARRARASARRCRRACGELATTPLDPTHPLWQFHLIEHYEGGSALIARIHHCIGDGIALISVMLSITDGGSDPPQRTQREQPDEAHEGDWLSDAVLKPLTDLTVKAIGMYGSGVGQVDGDAGQPAAAAARLAGHGAHRLPGGQRRRPRWR